MPLGNQQSILQDLKKICGEEAGGGELSALQRVSFNITISEDLQNVYYLYI